MKCLANVLCYRKTHIICGLHYNNETFSIHVMFDFIISVLSNYSLLFLVKINMPAYFEYNYDES